MERANKDVAIESLLNTFEEVWLSKLVELKHHVRVTDTSRQEVSVSVCVCVYVCM